MGSLFAGGWGRMGGKYKTIHYKTAMKYTNANKIYRFYYYSL